MKFVKSKISVTFLLVSIMLAQISCHRQLFDIINKKSSVENKANVLQNQIQDSNKESLFGAIMSGNEKESPKEENLNIIKQQQDKDSKDKQSLFASNLVEDNQQQNENITETTSDPLEQENKVRLSNFY